MLDANRSTTDELTPKDCLQLLLEHRRTWVLTTAVLAVMALVYSLVMPRYWEASQALVVRREVTGSSAGDPGKFADLYQMKTFQETILELARSKHVLTETWKAASADKSEVPTTRQIELLRRRLTMLPPKGSEFGKTEVFYLGIRDTDRERAVDLVSRLCRQLDVRLRELRDQRSPSVVDELEKQVELAVAANEADTDRLVEFETKVGPDLGELRMLNASFSGQSDLRQQVVSLQEESLIAEAGVREAEQLLTVLRAAQQDPERLIAMPSSLLNSQPTLRRLKDGLVDAQLRAARLEGTRTTNHPQVKAALESVEYIRTDLHEELQVAIRGVEIELGLSRSRASGLKKQLAGVQGRLARLAELRGSYANRVAAVENSAKVLDQARSQLGEVRAAQVAARSVSLITPLDQPETGTNPRGPGRATVVMIGTLAGSLLGFGWVFLTCVPLAESRSPESQEHSTLSEVPNSERPASRAAQQIADSIAQHSTLRQPGHVPVSVAPGSSEDEFPTSNTKTHA